MKDLLIITPSTLDNRQVNTVNARELHTFLESKQEFSPWIKNRIKKYDFVEGQDYLIILSNRSDGLAGKPRSDFHLTIDMAKELSMVERNAKGKEARQYFLECERKAQQPSDPMTALNDPAAMRGILLTYTEKVIALEEDNKILTPKAEALDRISKADGLTCITDTAKSLQIRPKDLFAWMSSNKWIYRRAGGKGWLAYQDKIQQGLLSHKVTTIQTSDGREKIIESVKVTPKGLAKLATVFQEVAV